MTAPRVSDQPVKNNSRPAPMSARGIDIITVMGCLKLSNCEASTM